VTLVDREAVRFLASVEAGGVRIVNCPKYVRTWIAGGGERQIVSDVFARPDDVFEGRTLRPAIRHRGMEGRVERR
jgi:hypothetical protein